jgi:hypothetical protein
VSSRNLLCHLTTTAGLSAKSIEQRQQFRFNRPVLSEVPFAETGGALTLAASQLCDRQPGFRNQRFAPDTDDSGLQ